MTVSLAETVTVTVLKEGNRLWKIPWLYIYSVIICETILLGGQDCCIHHYVLSFRGFLAHNGCEAGVKKVQK